MTPDAHPERVRSLAPDSLTGLTVVLACLDDAERLQEAVREATAAAARCAAEHEIVIDDAGSADESIAVAGAIAAGDPRVRVIVHAAGLGTARLCAPAPQRRGCRGCS